ncbi:hypothetical protein MNV_1360006 [Candidatus Methanoperedens nitroreducens]|uniref:Antitoxin n=1 Tax=Candidatus Methanoperedens nitratireducens TaxID=1392998 RepID=A0A284VKL0_9EURY|nr:hypothetical protein MNV_1360006 [Candidatus Methanoperedens nitroreducens]
MKLKMVGLTEEAYEALNDFRVRGKSFSKVVMEITKSVKNGTQVQPLPR